MKVEARDILRLLRCLTEDERIALIEFENGATGCLIDSGDGSDLGGAFERTLHALLDEYPDITDLDILYLTGMEKGKVGDDCGYIYVDPEYRVPTPARKEETPYTYLRWKAYMAFVQDQMLERGIDLCGLSILARSEEVREDFGLMDAAFEAVGLTDFDEFIEGDYKDSVLMRRFLDDRLFDAYLKEMGMHTRPEIKEKVRELIACGDLKTVVVNTGTYIRDDWDDVFRTEEDFVETVLANRHYADCLFAASPSKDTEQPTAAE